MRQHGPGLPLRGLPAGLHRHASGGSRRSVCADQQTGNRRGGTRTAQCLRSLGNQPVRIQQQQRTAIPHEHVIDVGSFNMQWILYRIKDKVNGLFKRCLLSLRKNGTNEIKINVFFLDSTKCWWLSLTTSGSSVEILFRSHNKGRHTVQCFSDYLLVESVNMFCTPSSG